MKKWFVYILKCSDDSLYTGITSDLEKRIKTHNLGEGAKYTRGRLPVRLIYYEKHSTRSQALKREYEIKQLSRVEKLELVTKPLTSLHSVLIYSQLVQRRIVSGGVGFSHFLCICGKIQIWQ